MFTSRSEFRLTLRPDNADLRLTEKGYKVGIVSEERYQKMLQMKSDISKALELLKDFKLPVAQWRQRLSMQQVKTTGFKR